MVVYLYMAEIVGFFLISFLIFSQEKSRIHIAFSVLAASAGAWQLTQFMSILISRTGSNGLAMFFFQVSVAASVLMATLLCVFCAIYAKKKLPRWLWVVPFAVSLFAFVSPEVANTVISNEKLGVPKIDAYYLTILIYNFLALLVSAYYLVVAYQNKKNASRRRQTMYMLSSFGIGGTIILMGSFYIPGISDGAIAQLTLPTAAFAIVATLAYAIRREGLFDVQTVAVRSTAYVASLGTIAVIYYMIIYLLSVLMNGVWGGSESLSVNPVNVIVAVILIGLFQPIRSFFDKVTNNIFFRDRYNETDFYARFNELLVASVGLRALLKNAATEVASTLKAKRAFFIVDRGSGHGNITAGTDAHMGRFPDIDIDSLREAAHNKGGDVLFAMDLTEDDMKLRRVLKSHDIAGFLVLKRQHKIIGYLALGSHLGSGYSKRDRAVLETISDELIIAIENMLSLQEVKDLNATLQQRIDAATAELRTSNARLKRLDASKDEFLSMASHQLRTPLTSVKGYLSMMLDGDVGKISPMQQKVLREAYSSSERMVHLIHDFLNVSRLQTGKFMLEYRETNLSDLVSQEVQSLKSVAESHTIALKYQNDLGPLDIMIDETKIRQVVMNYIDNAIYYSKPDTDIKVHLFQQDNDIVFTVKDTGIGVPKAEQTRLFEKFFRATNARRQRPDGTGVGLYLARRVMEAHGGSVVFESRSGRGSTFGFRIPLKKVVLKNGAK